MSNKSCKESVPELRPGYEVAVHQKIKEGNKERIQIFKGMVIAVNPGHGVDSTFTVRKVSEGIGVERVYPIHSPNIVKIDVTRAFKFRQSKPNFIRSLSGKALRFKELALNLRHKKFEKIAEQPISTEEAPAPVTEAPKEE